MALIITSGKQHNDLLIKKLANHLLKEQQQSLVLKEVQLQGEKRVVLSSLRKAAMRYNQGTPLTEVKEVTVNIISKDGKHDLHCAFADKLESDIDAALADAIFLKAGEDYVPDVALTDSALTALLEFLMEKFTEVDAGDRDYILTNYCADITDRIGNNISPDSLQLLLDKFGDDARKQYRMLNLAELTDVTPLYVEYNDSTKHVVLVNTDEVHKYGETSQVSVIVGAD